MGRMAPRAGCVARRIWRKRGQPYQAPGRGLASIDAALQLPWGHDSHGIRRLMGMEGARLSTASTTRCATKIRSATRASRAPAYAFRAPCARHLSLLPSPWPRSRSSSDLNPIQWSRAQSGSYGCAHRANHLLARACPARAGPARDGTAVQGCELMQKSGAQSARTLCACCSSPPVIGNADYGNNTQGLCPLPDTRYIPRRQS